jgi:hypothetical protein
MVKNRANTDAEKKEIIDRVYRAWLASPQLRLGQLLECAKPNRLDDLFNIEDYDLVVEVEKFSYNG